MHSRFFKRSALAALALSGLAHGQSSVASYNGLHAIVGARIEIGDGRVIEKGTVVIRDGMIVAVGADAAVPRGADVVDGRGLTVYPGFIDAYTTKGYTAPTFAKVTDPDAHAGDYASAFMRQTVRQGIRPEDRAVQGLSLTEEVLKPYQNAGFTTILVAPAGGDMSGVAALVNLSGRPTRECTVLGNAGSTLAFNGQTQGYPSSLMGHIAQLRQTFLDAQWYGAVERSFRAGGAVRPPMDDSLVALQPVIAGKVPVIFDADTQYPIEHSLHIASEFGLKPILAGGKEAWKALDEIKKSGAPVLVSLAFGKEPADPPPPPAGSTAPAPVKENPLKLAEKLRLYKEAVKNAAVLSEAGVPMALTTKGAKDVGEFMENLRKAVAGGLSKEAALRGLTIGPAKIFGVDRQLGTLEAGKIANVVVLTGDFLKADSKVKMLYIDGRKIDPANGPVGPSPRFGFGKEDGN